MKFIWKILRFYQNNKMEQEEKSQNEIEKEKGQATIDSKTEQQSKRKKIFIASCVIILLLGGVGILIWRLTLPSHSYKVDRQNTYETKARTCITNKVKSEDQALSEDCYEQVVSSRIVTNRVEQQQVTQSLIIDSTQFQYPNGSKLEIKGFETDTSTLDNLRRRRLQENTTDTVNETDPEFQSKLNSIPLFKVEVDPNDNTVKGIAIPIGVDRIIVSAAIQQLHHTNGGEEEKSSSLTGMRYINGRLYNPTIQRSSSIFGKREIQKEVSSKDISNSEDDNLQPYWDANIKQTFRTNTDGEVTGSEIEAKQVITQETDQQKEVDMVTSTSQSSELKEQKQIDEDDAQMIQYIQERQQFDYYDQSNISLACLKKEDQQEIIQLQQNHGEQENMKNGTRILVAASQAELINIQDQVIGEKNVLGQQIQVAYDIYGYLLQDNTTSVQASLYIKLNGRIWQTLFSFYIDNLKTQDSKNLHKRLDILMLKFVFPIVGIPCVIDISSRFEFGYNFQYQFAYPQSLVYFNAYGAFIIDASGYINAVVVHVGAGIQSAIVRANLPAHLDADLLAKKGRCQLSITAGSDLTLRLFARYPRISIIYRRICFRIFWRRRCFNIPVGLVFWFDEKTIYAISQVIAEKTWMLSDRQFTWK